MVIVGLDPLLKRSNGSDPCNKNHVQSWQSFHSEKFAKMARDTLVFPPPEPPVTPIIIGLFCIFYSITSSRLRRNKHLRHILSILPYFYLDMNSFSVRSFETKRTLRSFHYFTFSNFAANSLPPRRTSIFFSTVDRYETII